MKLYLTEIPTLQRPIIAGDHTPLPRPEASTLKDITYEHGAKVISGKPITLGHGYSTLAWIPEEKGSWALPIRHERITSLAKLGTTEKGQRWSDLMPILTRQLWLARETIEDNPLPWQKPQPREKLTPGRVAQSVPGVLAAIGTPAHTPKPSVKSPGWETGRKRNKKPRYPVVKKTVTRKKKEKKEAA